MVKKPQARSGLFLGSLYGAAVTLIISALLSGIFSILVSTGRAGEGSEGDLVAASAFLASCVGAIIAWRKNGGFALLSGTFAAAIAAGARLLLHLFAGTSINGQSLFISACMLSGGILTGFTASGRRSRHR